LFGPDSGDLARASTCWRIRIKHRSPRLCSSSISRCPAPMNCRWYSQNLRAACVPTSSPVSGKLESGRTTIAGSHVA